MALTAEDELRIQELMVRYTYLVDDIQGTENDFLNLFTEDAAFYSPHRGRLEGADALRSYYRSVQEYAQCVIRRHCLSNFLIEGDGDRARMRVYSAVFCTYQYRKPDSGEHSASMQYNYNVMNPLNEYRHMDRYDCDVRKVDGKWLFERRTVFMDGFDYPPGVPSGIPEST